MLMQSMATTIQSSLPASSSSASPPREFDAAAEYHYSQWLLAKTQATFEPDIETLTKYDNAVLEMFNTSIKHQVVARRKSLGLKAKHGGQSQRRDVIDASTQSSCAPVLDSSSNSNAEIHSGPVLRGYTDDEIDAFKASPEGVELNNMYARVALTHERKGERMHAAVHALIDTLSVQAGGLRISPQHVPQRLTTMHGSVAIYSMPNFGPWARGGKYGHRKWIVKVEIISVMGRREQGTPIARDND